MRNRRIRILCCFHHNLYWLRRLRLFRSFKRNFFNFIRLFWSLNLQRILSRFDQWSQLKIFFLKVLFLLEDFFFLRFFFYLHIKVFFVFLLFEVFLRKVLYLFWSIFLRKLKKWRKQGWFVRRWWWWGLGWYRMKFFCKLICL